MSDASQPYRLPPAPIADLVDAPEPPDVALSPDRRWMLFLERPNLPSIADLAEPELRLGGLRINPRTNGPSRTSPYRSLALLSLPQRPVPAVPAPVPIAGLPAGARIEGCRWSPDAAHIAFTLAEANGQSLWVADVATATARQLVGPQLNAVGGSPFVWSPDSAALYCRLVPRQRGPEPEPPRVPSGPVVQENAGKVAAAWTYQDLLRNPHDEAVFEHYLTAQIAHLTLDGDLTLLGEPGLIVDVEPSPDGRYLLVESLHRPFSYLVPVSRFPIRVDVWLAEGTLHQTIADLPLAEDIPSVRGAVRTGRRGVTWRADVPATLTWTEAQDGGDPRTAAEVRDRVSLLPAPFDAPPHTLADLALRAGGVLWGDGQLAIVQEWWWQTRRRRTWIIAPDDLEGEPRLLFDLSFEDRYADPGAPLQRRTPAGRRVLRRSVDGTSLYLSGSGASSEGDLPFLDRLDLASGQTTRLWRCVAPFFEYVVDILDADGPVLLTRRESVADAPNFFLRDLGKDTFAPITAFPHPALPLAGVQKELIRYTRPDGLPLSGMLYLPSGYRPEDGPLPLLLWAYPYEFKSAGAAGQITTSPHRFIRPGSGSPLFFLTTGYAILDGPTMPILGEGDAEPNDTYVEQLVASARAAVDEVVRRGIADRSRIAVGGHSYGAFMTANLLAHSDLFCAGIARSGAYNRTLTPFGFQAEDRTLWQAPEVYLAMSPYMAAEHISAPLLLIHGAADNNAGTYPLQSERFFDALKGLGATTRLVMLPHESHGYRARESVMHMLWEMAEWLDQYVKRGHVPMD